MRLVTVTRLLRDCHLLFPLSLEHREVEPERVGAGQKRAGEACEYTDQVVRANPWTSIGVGFGVGVLIGMLATLASTSSSRRWSV